MAKSTRRGGTGRTLSIDPRIRRIGWAYFEDALLADWGTRNVIQLSPPERVQRLLIPILIRMLDKFAPVRLVIPDVGPGGVRRSKHVREVIAAVATEALNRGIDVSAVSERW